MRHGPGTTVGQAKALLATGHLLAHQDYGLFTGQEHGVQATPGRRSPPWRRRLNYSLVGLERLRAVDHYARIDLALPDGPLTRTRSSDADYELLTAVDNSSVVRCGIANSVYQMHEAPGRVLALATPLCFTRSPRPGPVDQMTGWLMPAGRIDSGMAAR
jgi:hypothetical protein